MGRIAEEYGTLVFNDHTMQELLPSATYKALAKTIKEGKPLDIEKPTTPVGGQSIPGSDFPGE